MSNDRPIYITRLARDDGWCLRLPKRLMLAFARQEQPDRIVFMDDAHGGKRELALDAVIQYRDELFAKAGLSIKPLAKAVANPKNVTGLIGVTPGYRTSERDGQKYVSRWYALKGSTKQPFPVSKLGHVDAFMAAVRARESYTQQPFTDKAVKAALRLVKQMPAVGKL